MRLKWRGSWAGTGARVTERRRQQVWLSRRRRTEEAIPWYIAIEEDNWKTRHKATRDLQPGAGKVL